MAHGKPMTELPDSDGLPTGSIITTRPSSRQPASPSMTNRCNALTRRAERRSGLRGPGAALRQFRSVTGTDFATRMADLLADLMLWAERNAVNFDDELSRARCTATPKRGRRSGDAGRRRDGPPIPSEPADAVTTKTYKAEFFTSADYAFRNFEAETPSRRCISHVNSTGEHRRP